MNCRLTDLYQSLTNHFCALSGVPLTVVDAAERAILYTQSCGENSFFCDRCPNRCRLVSTMLYGCNEARRWNGRYVYYCPIGLVFSAVAIPETDHAILAGPVVVGELQDTLLDLPEYIDKQEVRSIPICSTNALRDISSVLEMAVYGIHYRPDISAYDRNTISDEKDAAAENAALYSSFPYMSDLEDALKNAVRIQDKQAAKATLNELLRYVYAPHCEQFSLIKKRAQQLMYLLAEVAADAGAGETEDALYRSAYIASLESAPSLEEMDVTLTTILHHFVDYLFDFYEVKHSDTIYRIMEYIKSNYEKKISLEDIASYVYLTSSHISSIFRKETGQTISAYISQIRIEKSKALLRNPDIAIADIAARCGFEDQSYFTRVFKKQTGISPKRYRDNTLSEMDFLDQMPPAEDVSSDD